MKGKKGKGEKMGNIREGDRTWETPNSVKRTRGGGKGGGRGGGGDWVMGTEGGTWWDEHWVLCYMLADWTPIKKPKIYISVKMISTIFGIIFITLIKYHIYVSSL